MTRSVRVGSGTTQSIMYMALAALRRVGLEVSHPRANLIDFLQSRSVDCVLDVGANIGQFGRWLRNRGYAHRIISFEPIRAAYQLLEKEAEGDAQWATKNLAVGDRRGTATINVGCNLTLSSFLPVSQVVLPPNMGAFKERTELVEVTTVDEFAADLPGNIFLKCDTQGFEREVLEGAKKSMNRMCGIQLEVPIVHLYQGTWTMPQAIEYMHQVGFVVSQIKPAGPVLRDKVSILEVDIVFRRCDAALDIRPMA